MGMRGAGLITSGNLSSTTNTQLSQGQNAGKAAPSHPGQALAGQKSEKSAKESSDDREREGKK